MIWQSIQNNVAFTKMHNELRKAMHELNESFKISLYLVKKFYP